MSHADQTLTVENASTVMYLVKPHNKKEVWNNLGVPSSRLSNDSDDEVCTYYVNYHPNSTSWYFLSKCLYDLGETEALKKVQSFQPSKKHTGKGYAYYTIFQL